MAAAPYFRARLGAAFFANGDVAKITFASGWFLIGQAGPVAAAAGQLAVNRAAAQTQRVVPVVAVTGGGAVLHQTGPAVGAGNSGARCRCAVEAKGGIAEFADAQRFAVEILNTDTVTGTLDIVAAIGWAAFKTDRHIPLVAHTHGLVVLDDATSLVATVDGETVGHTGGAHVSKVRLTSTEGLAVFRHGTGTVARASNLVTGRFFGWGGGTKGE